MNRIAIMDVMEEGHITIEGGEVELKHLDSTEMENAFTKKTEDKGPDKDINHNSRERKQMEEIRPAIPIQGRPTEETMTMIERDAPNKGKGHDISEIDQTKEKSLQNTEQPKHREIKSTSPRPSRRKDPGIDARYDVNKGLDGHRKTQQDQTRLQKDEAGSTRNIQNHNGAGHTTLTSSKNKRMNSRHTTHKSQKGNETTTATTGQGSQQDTGRNNSRGDRGEGQKINKDNQKLEMSLTKDAASLDEGRGCSKNQYSPEARIMATNSRNGNNIGTDTISAHGSRKSQKDNKMETRQNMIETGTIICMAIMLMEMVGKTQMWHWAETKSNQTTVATPKTGHSQQDLACLLYTSPSPRDS